MAARTYCNVAKKSIVDQRLVEDLSAFGQTVKNVSFQASGEQVEDTPVSLLPVVEDKASPVVTSGEHDEKMPVSLLPGPNVVPSPGVGTRVVATDFAGRCDRESVQRYDDNSLMQLDDFLLHRDEPEFESCKLLACCNLRQQPPMELQSDEIFYRVDFVDLKEQLIYPFNPVVDSCADEPCLSDPWFMWQTREFCQRPIVNNSPNSPLETFSYQRTHILGEPLCDPGYVARDATITDARRNSEWLRSYFDEPRRRVFAISNGKNFFGVLQDMFYESLIQKPDRGAVCLKLRCDGFHEVCQISVMHTDVCKSCGGYLPEFHYNYYYFPIIKHCVCYPMRPVVVKRVDHWLLLNYCDAFQRASLTTKLDIIRMLGGDKRDIVCCGQLGPIRVKQLGENGSITDDLYFIFLMCGMYPFVFTQKSLAEFAAMVFQKDGKFISKPRTACLSFPYYELVASCLRLENTIRFARAMFEDRFEKPYERTVIQLLGCQLFDHSGVLKLHLSKREDSREVPEMGWIRNPIQITWRSDPFRKIAEIDKHVSEVMMDLAMSEKLWSWFTTHLKQFYPDLRDVSVSFKQALIHLLIHYVTLEEFNTSFVFAACAWKDQMTVSEVTVYNAFHVLLWLGYQLVSLIKGWTRCFEEEKMEAGLITQHFYDLFLPFGGRTLVKNMIEDLRLYALLRTVSIDLFHAVQLILQWIVSYFKKNIMGLKDEYDAFINDVDSLQEVYYLEDGTSTSLRHQFIKDGKLRDRVMAMLTLGTQLRRQLEKTKASKDLLKQVNDRVNRLNKVVAGSSATFVGAEGKLKPFTVYLYGAPGSGKSVMLKQLFADLCYALGAEPFDESRDMYVLTANTGYHDKYAYQRFCVRNDVLQMKDDQQRVNEIYDLINMADETPYPLEIAQCEGKGQVYFTSPYLFMTSNFDVRFRTQELQTHMVEPDALIRRLDMIVEVHKVDYGNRKEFQRDKMRFTIQDHRGQTEKFVTWYGLVNAMVDKIVDQYDMSSAINTINRTQYDQEQLDRIKMIHAGNPMEIDDVPEDEDPLPRYVACSNKSKKTRENRKVTFVEQSSSPRENKSVELIQASQDREIVLSKRNAPSGFSCNGFEVPDLDDPEEVHYQGFCNPNECEFCLAERDFEQPEAGNYVLESLTNTINGKVDDLVEVVSTWTHLPQPSWLERKAAQFHGYLPEPIGKMALAHVAFYDSYALAVKCGVFAGAALAGWFMYKGVMSLLCKKEITQGWSGDVSGGEREYPRNRPKRADPLRKRPFARREFQQSGVSEVTGWAAPNGHFVEQAIFKNLCVVMRGDYRVNGLYIGDHILMLPLHIFKDVDQDCIQIVLHGGVTLELCMAECDESEVFIAEKNHVVFINTKRWTRLYPQWSHLGRFFVDAEKESQLTAEWAQMFTYRSSSLSTVGLLQRLMVENVAPFSGSFSLKCEDGVSRLIEKSVRGRVNTIFGDCGGPWVMDHETGARIVGIHVSSEKSKMLGRATLVTKQMIQQVFEYFSCKQLPLVQKAEEEAAENGKFDLSDDEYFDCEDTLICDMIGQTDVVIHNPSRTNLAQSIWRGITPVTKVPSRLREFKNKDGKMVRPTRVRFRKWIGKTVRIPIEKVRAVYPYLSQWYPRPGKDKRRVLTIEQAVFGEEDGINTSIEQNTSVGWPWKLDNRHRSEFFNIEERTITQEFREAVQAYLSGENFDTVVLDTLKDERVKEEKYISGDTRVFTICDFSLNVALKMLFGDFVHYLQSMCHVAPIKLGVSPLPVDWTKLYDSLTSNEGGLIAGDMSGWDHRCHFEVMMGMVDWINEWYDDEYQEIRYELARMTFEPVHLCDGSVFRARGGMPSGSYLTTPVNSLGVLAYIYMFVQSVVGEDLGKDNRLWLVPAIYGDDHVVAVAQHPEINQISFCEWFKSLGIIYTDEHKNAPTRPYTNINEVTFLKRNFVKRDGYVWGPLPEKNLMEQVQWYRRSATQRKKSVQQLSEEILDTVLNEFFFHGKEVYDKRKKELCDYAWQHAHIDVSNGAPSYKSKWEQFMGDGKPTPITRLSISPY